MEDPKYQLNINYDLKILGNNIESIFDIKSTICKSLLEEENIIQEEISFLKDNKIT